MMEAVVSMSSARLNELLNQYKEVKERLDGVKPFASQSSRSGYAHYTFKAEMSKEAYEKLGRHFTPDEVIMLVDGGVRNFGAQCSREDMVYSGRVNTD